MAVRSLLLKLGLDLDAESFQRLVEGDIDGVALTVVICYSVDLVDEVACRVGVDAALLSHDGGVGWDDMIEDDKLHVVIEDVEKLAYVERFRDMELQDRTVLVVLYIYEVLPCRQLRHLKVQMIQEPFDCTVLHNVGSIVD